MFLEFYEPRGQNLLWRPGILAMMMETQKPTEVFDRRS